jgi:hypothetical protein
MTLVACGPEGDESAAAAAESAVPEKAKRERKDRGEFTMQINEATWEASSSSARLRNGRLNISASRRDGSPSTTMIRQAIDIDIDGFDGPGTYPVGMMSSFSVVGMDVGAAKDADMNAQLAKVLSEASVLRLDGSEVVIETVSDDEITGRFSPGAIEPLGRDPVMITDGTFRAIVKE